MSAKQTRWFTTGFPVIHAKQLNGFAKDREVRISIKCNDVKTYLSLVPKKMGFGIRLYLKCKYCHCLREKLYLVRSVTKCRKCANLHIASNTMADDERAIHMIRKLRREIWGDNSIYDIRNLLENSFYWRRPKWMHYRTFSKKRQVLIKMENDYFTQYLGPMVNRLTNRIARWEKSNYS